MAYTRLILLPLAVACLACCNAPHHRAPSNDADGSTTSQVVATYALDAIFLGETDRAGIESPTAWAQFGYDLDDLITTTSSTDACHGSFLRAQDDGVAGTDNAFGAILLNEFRGDADISAPSANATTELRAGAWTLQIQLRGLTSDTNVDGIGMGIFTSASYGPTAPPFDATTDWPVLASSVAGPEISSGAVAKDDNAFVAADGLLVGRPSGGAIVLPISLKTPDATDAHGAVLPVLLRIHHPIITFRPSSDSHSLESGTIAGVLDTAELTAAVQVFAHNENHAFCGGTSKALVPIVAEAQDILADGSNSAVQDCNAISIGIGFTARLVANPTRVVPDVAVSDPCPD